MLRHQAICSIMIAVGCRTKRVYMICLALTGMTMNVVMSKTVAIGRIATTATIVDRVDVSSDEYSRSWQRCTVCNGIMSASRAAAAEQHCDVQPIRTEGLQLTPAVSICAMPQWTRARALPCRSICRCFSEKRTRPGALLGWCRPPLPEIRSGNLELGTGDAAAPAKLRFQAKKK